MQYEGENMFPCWNMKGKNNKRYNDTCWGAMLGIKEKM